MKKNWNTAIVTLINMAIYVSPGAGKSLHNNRPFHGFVLNDSTVEKEIHFSDGSVIKTGPYDLHYLPKGSDYRVITITPGGCYAINFDLMEDLGEKPFNISFRNSGSLLKLFKESVTAWKERPECFNAIIRKDIYDIISKIKHEQQRNYIPNATTKIISPAIDVMNKDFTRNNLSVKELATLCNISETYFRRLFLEKYSVSPKEYVIHLRIEYAKQLLLSGQFSVSEIAEMCGYGEPCHFTREFTKHTGVSPNTFKKSGGK